jgi:hypothetical protein
MMAATEYRETDESGTAVKGLATVAMLKANFDQGRDHLAMFEPFIRDAVATFPARDMSARDIRAAVDSRHGLKLPETATRSLLQRIVRHGFLNREGGRYFLTDKVLSSEDVLAARHVAEARQRKLALALVNSASERGIELGSPEDALAHIMSFMEAYHVRLAFDEPPDLGGVNDATKTISPQRVATALFLRDEVVEQGEFSEVVQEILEGFVLQNALLLRDISQASRQFNDVEAILDSQLLFGAVGLRGSAVETATKELLELLRQTGATISAFEPTIEEMRRVLAVYQERIGTEKGRDALYGSDLTRHLLDEAATPADVKQHSALLESNLHSMGIRILALPKRVEKWTLDEADLARALASKESGREDEPRVVHDIDCVASVLTLRQGKEARSLDSCRAIFVTNSGMTVRTVRHWYKRQGGGGTPPIIHELSLSNYAWLKQPASGAKLKLHELVALCVAALRPSREVWKHFVRHLRKLEFTGEISSDEAAAVVASDFTEEALLEVGIDEDSDAGSLSEVVGRVKRKYKAEADEAVALANQARIAQSDELTKVHQQVNERAESVAKFIIRVIFGAMALACVIGAVLSAIDALSGEAPSLLAGMLTVVPFVVLGALSALSGFHLRGAARKSETWLTARMAEWMLHGRRRSEQPGDARP